MSLDSHQHNFVFICVLVLRNRSFGFILLLFVVEISKLNNKNRFTWLIGFYSRFISERSIITITGTFNSRFITVYWWLHQSNELVSRENHIQTSGNELNIKLSFWFYFHDSKLLNRFYYDMFTMMRLCFSAVLFNVQYQYCIMCEMKFWMLST